VSLGEYIKGQRSKRGLTQFELSELTGLTRSHLSRLEIDDYHRPSAETFLALAKGLKVNPRELYEAAGYTVSPKSRRGPPKVAENDALGQMENVTLIPVPVFAGINTEESDVIGYACWGLSKNGNKDVIGLLADGFCLEPDIRNGDVIIVDTGKEPSPGNIVVRYSGDRIALARHDVSETADSDWRLYGVVVGINRRMA
jgi:transcriptional regulator with XRE-family HTH domain